MNVCWHFRWMRLVQGQRSDGKIAYLNALYDDFDNDRERLKQALSSLADSFVNHYQFQPKKYGLTLYPECEQPLFAGVLGKEKWLDVCLSERQREQLLLLALHLRGVAFSSQHQNLLLHPYGWVEVDDVNLKTALLELGELLSATPVILESHRDRYFRLSILPEVVYFSEDWFACALRKAELDGCCGNVSLTITRRAMETSLFKMAAIVREETVSLKAGNELRELHEKTHSADHPVAQKARDTWRKGRLHEAFAALGMRNLIREEGGICKIACKFELIDSA